MSESLQTLKGKYQLSLASVRELQHENELKDDPHSGRTHTAGKKCKNPL